VSELVTSVAHLDDGLMLEVDWEAALQSALDGGSNVLPAQFRRLTAASGAA
jgi:hypothetical protein